MAGLRPPHFGNVFWAAGAAQTPKTAIQVGPKTMYFKKLCRELQRSSSIFQWSLMLGPRCTLEFLIHGVGADRNSSKFGAWAAPSAQTKITKCGGLRPPTPTCWQGLWGRRGSSSPSSRPGRPNNYVKHRCAGSTRSPRPNFNETLRFGPHCTLRFLIHGFGGDRNLLVLGVWATGTTCATRSR